MATISYDQAIDRLRDFRDAPVSAAVWGADDRLEAMFGDRIGAIEPHDDADPLSMTVRFADGGLLVLDRGEFRAARYEADEARSTRTVRLFIADREVEISED